MNMPTFTLLAFMGLVAVAQGTEVANSDALAELRAKAEEEKPPPNLGLA